MTTSDMVTRVPSTDSSPDNKYDLLLQRYEREKKEWDLEKKKMENFTQLKRLTQLEQQLQMREARWQQHHNENCVYLAKLQKSLEAEKQQVKQLQLRLSEQESVINKQEQKVTTLTQQVKCLGKQKKFLRTTLARLQLESCTGKENSRSLWLDLELNRKDSTLNQDLQRTTVEVPELGAVTKGTLTSATAVTLAEVDNHIIEENKKLRKTNEEFSTRIKKLTITNARLKIHNRTCDRQSAVISENTTREVDELRQHLDSQKATIAALEKENHDLVRTSEELRLSLTQLETDCNHLRQELKKKKAKIGILKHKQSGKFEIRVLERKLTEKTAEVSELTKENEWLRIHTEKSTEVISRLMEENSAMIRAEQFQKKLKSHVDRKAEALVSLMNEKEFLCAELHTKTENLEKVVSEKNALLLRLERLEVKLKVGTEVEECVTIGDATKTENLKENLKTETPKENPKQTEKTNSEERLTGKNGRPRNKVSFDSSIKPPEKLFLPLKTLEQNSSWGKKWSSIFWNVLSGRL